MPTLWNSEPIAALSQLPFKNRQIATVDAIGRKVRIEELAPKPTKVARLTQIAAGAPTLAVAEKMAGASWAGWALG